VTDIISKKRFEKRRMNGLSNNPIGLLVMAYGGPNSLDEVPGYLADIRTGRTTPANVLQDITHNYRQIGGSSPLLQRTREQIAALERMLSKRFPEKFRIYLGMRHWAPRIEETVAQMIDDNISRAVAIVLAPHFSNLSVAKYQKKIQAGLEMYRGEIQFSLVDHYHNHPKLIAAFADRLDKTLRTWPAGERDLVHIVLTAHSLPVRILGQGDPYPTQLQETARLVTDACGLADDRWSWSYQSAGRSAEPWLGPPLDEHLQALAQRGVKNVLVMPIGFVSDHVEIQFDIDIQAQAVARECGLLLKRPSALNDDFLFIEALADVVAQAAEDWLVLSSNSRS
jgi:ferrochelatase